MQHSIIKHKQAIRVGFVPNPDSTLPLQVGRTEPKEDSYWNEVKTMKSGRNIDVDSKGTFKWVENLLEKGWKRRFSDGLGLSSFKLSHPSLELTLSGLHLSELRLTDRLIRLVG